MATETIFVSKYPDVELPTLDLTSFVLQKAETYGDKVALVDFASGRSYTYKQIPALVKKTTAGLHARGVTRGTNIALYSPNLPEFAFPFLGAASLGAATALANPTYNPEELSKILKDTKPLLLFTVAPMLAAAKAANELAGNPVKEFVVFGEAEGATPFAALLNNNGDFPKVEINVKEDVVALPFSSGTTGLPKAVALTHFNLTVNMNQASVLETDMTSDDVLIGLLPFFHIYGLQVVLLLGLYLGVKTVTMMRFDLEQFLKIIQEHKVSRLHVVPPICLALAKHPLVGKFDVSSVNILISAAAPLGDDLSAACVARFGVPIKQGYGMTEASPATHVQPTNAIRQGAVGLLVPNMKAKIVHVETGKEQTPGKENVGEIWLRGPNIMKGYLNNEQATKDSITEDGWYKTGDIGYVDEDGYYYLVDRLKELIKFKGFQVAPAELEDLLMAHPAVADCAVIGIPDEEAGELPQAHVVKAPGKEVTEEDLKQHIALKLSSFKHLRGGVVFTNEIPKSASGKILRRILKAKALEKK